MTVTINRNLLIFVVALVALAGVGYVIGTQVTKQPSALVASGTPIVITATLPGAAAPGGANPQVTVPTAAPDTAPRIEVADFKKDYDAKADMLVVDVRTPQQYAAGHIAGAVNIPEAEASGRLAELPKDKHIVLYCA